MAIGQGGAKGRCLCPTPHGFVLPHPRPAPHDGENFLIPSLPHPIKLYELLICPTNSTNFFLMKPISLIKIYLKLQLNLSNQIKSIFTKKIE